MRTRRLGSEGPELSVIGFGAWQAGGRGWGPNPPEGDVIRAMHEAVDAGVNWIDTAEIYGSGQSELVVGRALAEARHREGMLIASKVAPKGSGTGFRAKQVRKACEQSLARLGTDVIDLYQLHWTDRSIPVEETWSAMVSLVEDGLVRWIGVSNFKQKLIERCEAVRHVDSLQPEISLLTPELLSLAAWCGDHGIGVVPYSPLACGMLTGTITADTVFGNDDFRSGKMWDSELYAEFFAPGKLEQSLAVVDGLRPIAARVGCTIAQLSLAWLLAQPGVTSPIVGTRNAGHIVEDAGVDSIELDSATLAEIEAVAKAGPAFA
jgi:aryl-alcohol dehydrogenase-like predicted oxidoreductase